MKTLPYVACRNCKRVMEVETVDDLVEKARRVAYDFNCPCGHNYPVSLEVALAIIDREEKPEADEKTLKYERAKEAMETTGGNRGRAAEILGVSKTTIDNWMKFKPAETVLADNN